MQKLNALKVTGNSARLSESKANGNAGNFEVSFPSRWKNIL